MTAQEIHIDLDYHIQKINSNATRNIEAKEKDWIFNEEVSKFLASRTRPASDIKGVGFQGDTKRLKDVRPLITSKVLEVEVINDKLGKVILPSFCYKEIRIDCNFFKLCEESKYKVNKKINTIKYFKFPNATDDFKVNITIGNVTKTLFDTEHLPSSYIKGNYFYLLKAFIIKVREAFENDEFYKNNLEFYFQWFGDEFRADTFYFKGSNDFVELELKVKQFIVTNSPAKRNPHVKTFTTNLNTYTSAKGLTSSARISNEEFEIEKVNSNLSKSLQESPIVSIEKGVCYVHNPKNTIIKSIKLVYIEQPQQIDLSLNQSLNLDRSTIQEIVVNTSRFIKALFDSNNYEKYLKESTLIE